MIGLSIRLIFCHCPFFLAAVLTGLIQPVCSGVA